MPWKRQGRREIVHIVVTGYEKKKMPSKHYVSKPPSERERFKEFTVMTGLYTNTLPGVRDRCDLE